MNGVEQLAGVIIVEFCFSRWRVRFSCLLRYFGFDYGSVLGCFFDCFRVGLALGCEGYVEVFGVVGSFL